MFFEHEGISEIKIKEITNKASIKGGDDQMPSKTPSEGTIDRGEIQESEHGIDVEELEQDEIGVKKGEPL